MGDVPPLRIPVRRKHLISPPLGLWAVFTLFIIYGTVLPFRFVSDPVFIRDKVARITLNPFMSPDTGRRVSIPDVAQNVLLFLPFGFLGVLALNRPGTSRILTVAKVAALTAAVSAGVETLQLFTLDRTTSFTDVVASTIGAVVGGLACRPLTAWWARWRRTVRSDVLTGLPAFDPFVAAGLLVCAAALAPFDITLDVGNVVGKLHVLQADPWQRASFGAELLAMSRFLVFGMTSGLLLRQAGVRAAVPMAMIAGSVVAAGLELGQWLIVTRMPGVQDAGVQIAATVAGAAISIGWPYRLRPMFWWVLWTAVTTTGAVLARRVPIARESMALLGRAFEVVLLILPVFYGWVLVRREPNSYAWR